MKAAAPAPGSCRMALIAATTGGTAAGAPTTGLTAAGPPAEGWNGSSDRPARPEPGARARAAAGRRRPRGAPGEGPAVCAYERLGATEALLKGGIPAANIALGTGFPAIPDTVALSRQAMALGLTHMLILPPYFFRNATEPGLEDAFSAIVE